MVSRDSPCLTVTEQDAFDQEDSNFIPDYIAFNQQVSNSIPEFERERKRSQVLVPDMKT